MILVFGSDGQVGRELARYPDVRGLTRAAADLTKPAEIGEVIRAHAPRAVINAAAFTGVDAAETERDLAMAVNGDAPGVMARSCADLGIPLVQISTDYVFDGSGTRPWRPGDPAAPLGAYGRSKLAGEQAVQAAGGVHVILRSSWVFSARGCNFVKTMLRLGAERDRLRVVADQVGGPTAARDIARACRVMAERLQVAPELTGIQHFAGAPDISWAGFAREIFARAGLATVVEEIPSRDYPTPARRPLNSRLDCAGLAAFGLDRPGWGPALDDVIRELGGRA